jgi:hypothetical protein
MLQGPGEDGDGLLGGRPDLPQRLDCRGSLELAAALRKLDQRGNGGRSVRADLPQRPEGGEAVGLLGGRGKGRHRGLGLGAHLAQQPRRQERCLARALERAGQNVHVGLGLTGDPGQGAVCLKDHAADQVFAPAAQRSAAGRYAAKGGHGRLRARADGAQGAHGPADGVEVRDLQGLGQHADRSLGPGAHLLQQVRRLAGGPIAACLHDAGQRGDVRLRLARDHRQGIVRRGDRDLHVIGPPPDARRHLARSQLAKCRHRGPRGRADVPEALGCGLRVTSLEPHHMGPDLVVDGPLGSKGARGQATQAGHRCRDDHPSVHGLLLRIGSAATPAADAMPYFPGLSSMDTTHLATLRSLLRPISTSSSWASSVVYPMLYGEVGIHISGPTQYGGGPAS